MSMCVRECIRPRTERRVSAQWPVGGRGVWGRGEEIYWQEKWRGQREKEYGLLMRAVAGIDPGLGWSASGAAEPPVHLTASSSQSSEKMFCLRSYKPAHNGRSVCAGQHNKGRMACCFLIKNVKGLGFKRHYFFYFFFSFLLHSAFVLQVHPNGGIWLLLVSCFFFVFFLS